MSLTISSVLVALLGLLLTQFHIKYAPEEVTSFVNLGLQLGGLVFAWYGRYRLGDVGVLGNRKK